MPTQIQKSGPKPQLPDKSLTASIGQAALGEIQYRTGRSIGANDVRFAPYSLKYLKALQRASQQLSVDLQLTGRLMGSLRTRVVTVSPTVSSVEVFAGTGAAGKTSLAEGRLQRKGSTSLSLNRLGYYLHHGTGDLPARPWLGLPVKVLEQLWHDLYDSKRK